MASTYMRTVYKAAMTKRADGGAVNDALGATVVPGASMLGQLVGFASGPANKEDLKAMDRSPELSWVPGVGGYRLMRKTLATSPNASRSLVASENLGMATTTLLLGALGAGIGKSLGGGWGATLGGVAGLYGGVGANALGTLIGIARKRRTQKEQTTADANSGVASQLANYLVPGVAAHDAARRSALLTLQEDQRNLEAEKNGKA